MKTIDLIKLFKEYFYKQYGFKIDYRTHVYLENEYALSPTYDYYTALDFINGLYDWAHKFIEENRAHYPDFNGFQYNTSIEMNTLRAFKLSQKIEGVCDELAEHYNRLNETN